MGVNQVIYDGETIVDLTDSTVTEQNMVRGTVAYNAAGERIVGTGDFVTPEEQTEAISGAVAESKKYTDTSVSNATKNMYPKTTYEYNKEIRFGSTGVLCIGKFNMYDSNITIKISSTTALTYNGTLVIATQNYGRTSGRFMANVYGDVADTIAPNIYIYNDAPSGVVEVYFKPASWSKNLVHIQCMALQATPTDIASTVSSVPENATTKPDNLLKNAFNSTLESAKAYTDANAGGASSWNDLNDKPFFEDGDMVQILPDTTLATEEYRGQFKILTSGDNDTLCVCLKKNGVYRWCPLYEKNTAELGKAILGDTEIGQD